MKEVSRTLRRRTGQALGEIDRLTGEIAAVARATLRDVEAVERNARRALGKRPWGRLALLVGELAETAAGTPPPVGADRLATGWHPHHPRPAGLVG